MLKNVLGLVLYCFLGWCLVHGYFQRKASQDPGLESLVTTLLHSTPLVTHLKVTTPNLEAQLIGEQIECSVKLGDQIHNIVVSGSFYPSLDIKLTTSGKLTTLLKQFYPKSLFLAGDYYIEANVFGEWDRPDFESLIIVTDASADSLSTGIHLEDIYMEIHSQDKTFTIQKASAHDGQGGTLSGQGSIDLSKSIKYVLDIEVNKFMLIQLGHASGLFSGSLIIDGDDEKTSIAGTLDADSITFALNESKTSPKTIEITYINADTLPQQTKQKKDWPLNFDILLTSKQNIWITDQNLNSEWKADLKLQGNSQAPLLFGSLEMIRGQYVINGKPVDIKEGSIHFDGDPLKNATLSVIGSLESNTIIAEAVVNGPLINPSLSLRSNPPLPQADILSHLVFGRGLADITPQQSKMLKKSFKDLKAMSTGTDVLAGVRNRFGIDRIEVSRGKGKALEDVSLQVGKYLTKGLYVAFDKGITSTANRFILEASLRPNLKLLAEISDTAEGQLHLKWRYDY